jgi:hypothetical protein
VETRTAPVDLNRPPDRIAVPRPKPINTAPIKWKVLTEENIPTDKGWVYYGITPEQYEVLSRNMADILRWVQEAEWRLNYYSGTGKLDGDK